jgi:hypothetical protein
MDDLLDRTAILFIKYYPPIDNIAHKYKTKVTAIGLLKQINLVGPDYFMPYYERLMSYKLLVKDLVDNIKISEEAALKIMTDIIHHILTTQGLPPPENFEASDVCALMRLVYPKLREATLEQIYELSPKFLDFLKKDTSCQQVATNILRNFLKTTEQYDLLAQKIVKMCLTRTQQEEVMKRMESSIYNFFIYFIFDKRQMNYQYETYFRFRNGLVTRLDPFVNTKVLSRAIINQVGGYMTTVNFFGSRLNNYDELRELFKKNQNIMLMFF